MSTMLIFIYFILLFSAKNTHQFLYHTDQVQLPCRISIVTLSKMFKISSKDQGHHTKKTDLEMIYGLFGMLY